MFPTKKTPRPFRTLLLVLFAALSITATSTVAAAEFAIDAKSALKERAIGDPAAPVTMIEYASLTCPHCASFHNDTYKAFKARYIDTGKVRLIYRDFPLDGMALRAAAMARCAVDQRYFGLLEVLYKTQANWARASDPVAELLNVGRLAGINQEMFDACMASEELLDGILAMRQRGSADGVQSTPTFVINGRYYPGSRSIEEFAKIIEPLLKDK
jgi:protein-disulfide isomerase